MSDSKNFDMDYNKYKQDNNKLLNTKIGPYIIQKYIGSGAYGSVYRGIDDNSNQYVAIKVLDLAQIQKDPNGKVRQIRRRLSKTQSQLMMKCDSQNVLKCYQVYQNKDLKIMVIQYCNGGNLQTQIINRRQIPQQQAINILKQLILGLSELHKHCIIHRDLKAENILIHNGVYKIADFGFSKMVNLENTQMKHTTLGTIITMAPQIMKRLPYGLKADIWSLGVIFYQMLVGKLPYQPMPANSMYDKIKTTKLFNGDQLCTKIGPKLSKKTIDCLKKMLTFKTQERITWRQLLNHPIFADQNSQQLTGNFVLGRTIKKVQINKKMQGAQFNIDQQRQELQQKLQEMSDIGQGNKKQPEILKLTAKDVQQRAQKVDVSAQNAFKWGKKTYWQCLKTQLIYKEIIVPIEKSKILEISRTDLQFFYLLSSRCFFNLSPINEQISKNKNEIAINLKNTITDLYEKVFKSFEQYSKKLKKEQDKMSNIFIDRVSRLIKNQSYHQKQKFLIGIQYNHDYSLKGVAGQKASNDDFGDFNKKQQIEYTAKNYIPQILKQLIPHKNKLEKAVQYLKLYKAINNIEFNEKKQFRECLNEVLKGEKKQE